jgi:hypothetical protein
MALFQQLPSMEEMAIAKKAEALAKQLKASHAAAARVSKADIAVISEPQPEEPEVDTIYQNI